MKDSLYLKKHMWLIFFIAVWCFTGLIDKAESGNKVISLNVTKTQLEKILITKSAEVQLSNDSLTTPVHIEHFKVANLKVACSKFLTHNFIRGEME